MASTGLATLALAGVFAGVFLPSGGASTNGRPKAAATTKVTVKASEFKYVFSRKSVPDGDGDLHRHQQGQDLARLQDRRQEDASRSRPASRQKLTVKFTKKGQYAFLCTLFGHAKAGMKGKYAVATARSRRRRRRRPPPPHDDDAAAHRHRRQREHDRPGRHVRVRLQPLPAVGPVGPGHVRDQEQRQRGAQLLRPGREGRRACSTPARRRRTPSGCPRRGSATSATCRSTSIAACWEA